MLSRGRQPGPRCGVGRTWSSGRVKTLLLCLAVAPGGVPPLLVAVTQAPHNNRAFSEPLSAGQGPAGGACAGRISLCGSCVQARLLRWGEWVVDRVARAPSQAVARFVPVLPIAEFRRLDKLPLRPAWSLPASLPSHPSWPQRSPFSVSPLLLNTTPFVCLLPL